MFKKLFESVTKEKIIGAVQEKQQSASEWNPLETNSQNNYLVTSAVIDKMVELAKNNLIGSVLHTSDIPAKKISNVVNIYGINENQIIALYDTTVFKSGKDGIVLCNHCLGWKHAFGSAMMINFKDLVTSGINDQENTLYVKGDRFDLKSNEFTVFFKKLKELFLLEDSYLKSMYEDYVKASLCEIEEKIGNSKYDEADRDFRSLEAIITDSTKGYLASLNYYGCLIRMEQANFDEAYRYFSRLEELQQWETSKLATLKQTLDVKKAQYEFDLLEKQKENYIQEKQFAKAIDLVAEQKNLGVKRNEQLDSEIQRIESLKEAYIRLLEADILKKLESEEYASVLSTIEKLSEVNPHGQYDEYEVLAKIGIYAFEEAELKIISMKDVNEQLAIKLEQNLQQAKTKVTKTIQEAVYSKNYRFFTNYPSLKNIKDSWGMTPLMYFILQKDLDGVQLLASTYRPDDRNILGHTALNLVSMDVEDDFMIDACKLLDKDLIEMLKKLKSKEAWNKAGNLLIKGIDGLNKNVGDFSVMSATAEMETQMNTSLEGYQQEVEAYIQNLCIENHMEYLKGLLQPKDLNKEYNELIVQKQETEMTLEKLYEKKGTLENSFEDELRMAKNAKLESILYEAARIELGKKDEFETSAEFDARRRKKAAELKLNYRENHYVKGQLDRITAELKVSISNELNETQNAIQLHEKQFISLNSQIADVQHLLNCRFDVNEVLGCYYQAYVSKLDIGVYDADLEVFNMIVNQEEKQIKVPRAIAKNFKMQFTDLLPKYNMQIVNHDDQEKIQHAFVYEFEDEQIEIPFLLSFLPNSINA